MRSPADAALFAGVAGVTPLTVDVTDPDSVASAAGAVGAAVDGGGLDALVNNAGLIVEGPLESFSVALRVELAPWRIPVVVVEPTGTRTPVLSKAAEASAKARAVADPALVALYERQLAAAAEASARMSLADPDDIAKVLVKAVHARRPKALWTAGRGAGLLPTIGRLPTGLSDRVVARALGVAKIEAGA
ncbi:hypothetical protein [Streptomyces radicis]|uniref:hypothetical protein n=1 Tax=Streptomyces radicis TaxID=1750517 RepID=UPI0011C3EEF2|nr:hypothetical protein [Streptomyces radicis]